MAEGEMARWVYYGIRLVLLLFGSGGRRMLRRLAPAFGRLSLSVEPQVPVNFAGEKPPYDMLSLLVSNQAKRDAQDTRCEVRWQRMGKAFAVRGDTVGAWMKTHAVSMSSFVGPPDESRTLNSNGQPERLGLLVKYAGQADAFIVDKHNFISTTQRGGPRWAHASYALQPGGYELRLLFTSAGNVTGEVTINVWNDGSAGGLRSDLHPLSTN